MISIPVHDNIDELWSMSVNEFNKWRMENDLPILFEYFNNKLPCFKDWLEYNDFNIEYLIQVVPTGGIFTGDKDKKIIEYIDLRTDDKRYEISDLNYDEIEENYDKSFREKKINKGKKIHSLFYMGQENLKR